MKRDEDHAQGGAANRLRATAPLTANAFAQFEQQVIAWLAEWASVPASRLAPSTEVNRVLGVDGADADDMVAHLAKRGGVTFDGFEFDRYFGPEVGFVFYLDRIVDFIAGRRRRPIEPLTVAMLARFMWAKHGEARSNHDDVVCLAVIPRGQVVDWSPSGEPETAVWIPGEIFLEILAAARRLAIPVLSSLNVYTQTRATAAECSVMLSRWAEFERAVAGRACARWIDAMRALSRSAR
jgi:hypothetical protein